MKRRIFTILMIFFAMKSFAAPKNVREIYSYDRSYPEKDFQFFIYDYGDLSVALWAEGEDPFEWPSKDESLNLFFYDRTDSKKIEEKIYKFQKEWNYGIEYFSENGEASRPHMNKKELEQLKNQLFAELTSMIPCKKNEQKSLKDEKYFEFYSRIFECSEKGKQEKKKHTFIYEEVPYSDIAGCDVVEKTQNLIINYHSTQNAEKYITSAETLLTGIFSDYQDNLRILSYSEDGNEFNSVINNYYLALHPQTKIKFVDWSRYIPFDYDYQSEGIYKYGNATINHSPDLVLLRDNEDAVRGNDSSVKFINVKDVYDEVKGSLLNYPDSLISSNDDNVYGIPVQTYYGVMFYRRSLARKYFGTGDPDVIQKYFSDWNQFLSSARLLNGKSNGRCKVISSCDELDFLIQNENDFLCKNECEYDPDEKTVYQIKDELYGKGLVPEISMLKNNGHEINESYICGIKNELTDRTGKPVEIFAYFLPTWGLNGILKKYASETSGDWAMIEGPEPVYWESICISVTEKNIKTEQAKQFIKNILTDENFLTQWAVKKGGMITNKNVMDKLRKYYREPFLGGQKMYQVIYEISEKIKAD